ncbi:methionine synthase [Clostridium acetireducens DSM 10703]|uniref:Methionine synthase n=1 Tax=Clostridium acetireducens DSM 10703 TaxID=1121290 RepID=A0A1E8EZB3_9CLOT|nr:homocysteine S-methyltransferase family protein [Clostridium acetireducens]OFI06055.1 methionine synthase [Clostridium acetireducens DSM 10703]
MGIKEDLLNKFLFFDGAMGTMLQNRGLKAGEIPETYNILHPEIIKDIHEKYIEAGSNIIITNTFGANELKLKNTGYSVEEVITEAVNIAKSAKGEKYIALDIGPIGQLMEPIGTLKFEKAYEIFKRQVVAGSKAGCHVILIETISDIYEAKAAVLAAKENSNLPVFCTMTFAEDGRTFTGTDPITMVTVLEGLGVDALGLNCSLGPKEIMPIVEEILKYSSIPVIVQPNAGLPRVDGNKTVYDITEEEFASYMKTIAEKGARILGGCCGTNDDFIRKTVEKVENIKVKEIEKKEFTAITSYSKTVLLGEEVKIIGERINPTGKKKFKEALKTNNMDYILNEAIMQKEAKADILDVNVGLPEINEEEVMIKVIREIQSIIDLPLQIDSSNSKVIEKAVRIYNGKPIINSVNGKEEVMESIFPIAKKYGAVVIGLTLDEKGIPSKAEDRVKIAEKIINKANEYGIDKKDIIIDCLVLTVSAQQKEVMETIKAVKMVKDKFNVKTTLGVSNVSFGLPNRSILNKTFLAMALAQGLDAPILNPNNKDVIETINAFKVLANQDKDAKDYVKNYSNIDDKKEVNKENNTKDLKNIIISGIKEEAKEKTKELLKIKQSMEIVDEYLIPALDIVGKKYEKGEIFLPQLIQSAETVKNAFEIIREKISIEGKVSIYKGKIILATVQGDIHDIGKNIVKVILENYGFEVIDLGKDVPIKVVVEKAKQNNIKLVGLSALMTTTVKSMEETIKALRKNNINCKVFVGGAVLNEEYAKMIKADYYAKDAQEAVKIAQKEFRC